MPIVLGSRIIPALASGCSDKTNDCCRALVSDRCDQCIHVKSRSLPCNGYGYT